MSYSTPVDYTAVYPTMGLPAELTGAELKAFHGSRANIRYIPSTSGSAVGPSSSILFSIPNDSNSFLKPSTLMLRLKCTVTTAADVVANGCYAFAGQNTATAQTNATINTGVGGGSSLINRVTVTLPGGTAVSYNQWSHMQNAVVKNHCLSNDYVNNDLRELESATVMRIAAAAGVPSRTTWLTIPLNIPIFQSSCAYPLCLVAAPTGIEITTNTLNDAFYSVATTVNGFSLDNCALIYETISCSSEFVAALRQAKASVPYTIAVNDWAGMSSGVSGAGTSRLQFALAYSSYKGVCFTFQAAATAVLAAPKFYSTNGMTSWVCYLDGVQVSPSNLNSSDFVYSEMSRCLGRILDSNLTSCLTQVTSVEAFSKRNNYDDAAWLSGCSSMTLDDSTLSHTGVSASNLVLEINLAATQDAGQWQQTIAAAAQNCYVFIFYDSVIQVLADGSCIMKR